VRKLLAVRIKLRQEGASADRTELTDKGYRVVEDQPLEGYERCCVEDLFGNRIELMEPNASGRV
jgi:hypothetical protein